MPLVVSAADRARNPTGRHGRGSPGRASVQ